MKLLDHSHPELKLFQRNDLRLAPLPVPFAMLCKPKRLTATEGHQHRTNSANEKQPSTDSGHPARGRRVALPQLYRLDSRVSGLMAREDIHVVVVHSRSSNHESVWMECGCSDGRGPVAQKP